MDRRVSFFLGAAILSLILVPVSPPEFRIVCEVTAGVYAVLALATALDRRSRRLDLIDHARTVNERSDNQRTDDQRATDESSSAR